MPPGLGHPSITTSFLHTAPAACKPCPGTCSDTDLQDVALPKPSPVLGPSWCFRMLCSLFEHRGSGQAWCKQGCCLVAEHAMPLWNLGQQEMLPVATHKCWPRNTKTVSKGKNQADAAAGELPAQAGLGKQRSAHGQVGGSMAPPQRGGAGEGNPVKRCHGSASSAEARSTDLPQKCGQVNSSRWAGTQGREGRCSAYDSCTAQHCPTLHMPSPLLSLLASYQAYGESSSGALPGGFSEAGMIHILTKLTELGTIRFPKAPKAQWTPCRANTARR